MRADILQILKKTDKKALSLRQFSNGVKLTIANSFGSAIYKYVSKLWVNHEGFVIVNKVLVKVNFQDNHEVINAFIKS